MQHSDRSGISIKIKMWLCTLNGTREMHNDTDKDWSTFAPRTNVQGLRYVIGKMAADESGIKCRLRDSADNEAIWTTMKVLVKKLHQAEPQEAVAMWYYLWWFLDWHELWYMCCDDNNLCQLVKNWTIWVNLYVIIPVILCDLWSHSHSPHSDYSCHNFLVKIYWLG